jgi:hypothetical protein
MDPITAMLLLNAGITAAKGISSGISARSQAEDQRERAQNAYNAASAEYERLRAQGLPEYKIGSSYKKYLDMARRDPVADMQRRIAAEQEASNIQALKSGGARALIGGLSGVSRAAAQNRSGIEAESYGRMQDALKTYAGEEQSVMDANTRAALAQYKADLLYSRGAADTAMGLIYGAEDAKRAANQEFINTGIDLLGMGLGHTQAFGGPGYGGGGGGANAPVDTGTFSDAELDYMMGPQFGEQGMKVSKTPGPFSHATNPIHIVRNGRKIGEMTGGEVILNPDQEKKVASQSPYFRQLLRKFNQQNK